MCGIAGILDFDDQPSEDTVRRMCRCIRHRGPDHEGVWCGAHIGLGHVRLSIIDLSASGNQPMANENNTTWVSYNGEIYNYKSLRRELGNAHVFRSQTDTEVLVHSWEELGVAVLPKLNGIFACALWDTNQQRLTLVRDPLGVKPLYYWHTGNRLVFASEIKAILASGVPREVDMLGLAEHFSFQNTFGDRTLFRDVRLLPAGHYLEFDRRGFHVAQYYDVEFREDDCPVDEHECAERVRSCFESSVKRQLVSDVPIGTYLSGGMDTGSISAVAAREIPGLRSFSCGFDTSRVTEAERSRDERAEAQSIAKHVGTRHREIVLDHTDLEKYIAQTIWHLDEPRMGISYQVLRTAQMVGSDVKVVLSGVGGDELFAGYPWRYRWCFERPSEEAAYTAAVRFFDDKRLLGLFTEEARQKVGTYSSRDRFREAMGRCTARDPVNRALYYDLKTFLNGILVVDDKLNMAHSVEARVPFLDTELVHLALGIPSTAKLRGDTGKTVLREAMRGLLPEAAIAREKRGFTPPDRSWIKDTTWPYFESMLLGSKTLQRGIFNEKALRGIISEHRQGQADHRFLLWSLAGFEWMSRLFIDTFTPERPS